MYINKMVTVVNPLDDLKTLLISGWNAANTDSVTPLIDKIYVQAKNKNPNPGQDFVYLYSELTSRSPVGIGNTSQAEVVESIKIDIRSRPSNSKQGNLTSDSHARKVWTELDRILYTNFNNPSSNFHQLNPNLEVTDLSDGVRGIFRYVVKINMTNYCKNMV